MDKGHAHAYTRSARPRRRPPTVPRRLLGLRSVQRGDRPPARRARLRQTRLRQLHPVQDVPGDALRQLLRPRPGEGNAAVYDALVGVGLLRRDGDSYDLTPAGREDYKPESKAFCYSSGFDVSVRSVDPAKPDDYGPAVEKGWLVTVEVKPREVKDWAKNPGGAQAGQPDHPATDHPTAGRPGLRWSSHAARKATSSSTPASRPGRASTNQAW
ncbi:hypothetical protein ACPA9J_15405 [Pseudomonas aeruginosa]